MNCVNPVRITKNLDIDKYPGGIEVPCGKCLNCRIQKRTEWNTRLLHELESWDNALFVTLTYDNEHLPDNKSLSKDDLQKFFKRLRKRLNKKIKYYASGEYGDINNRPHYHTLIFGVGYEDIENIINSWNMCDWNSYRIKNGIGLVEADSINYVTGYISKKYSGELEYDTYTKSGRETPFSVMSKGLGLSYLLKEIETIQERQYVTIKGQRRSIPKYYVQKKKINIDKAKQVGIDKEIKKVNKLTGKKLTRDELYMSQSADEIIYVEDKLRDKKKQHELNTKKRLSIKERKL